MDQQAGKLGTEGAMAKQKSVEDLTYEEAFGELEALVTELEGKTLRPAPREGRAEGKATGRRDRGGLRGTRVIWPGPIRC